MKEKVLIVDDEEDVGEALKILLEKHDIEVTIVNNGKDCLKELAKGFRGVILMDIMMPSMDGWDTIKQIIKRGYIDNVSITIITGKGTKDHKKMIGLEAYITDYLSKPFAAETLLTSIRRAADSISNKFY